MADKTLSDIAKAMRHIDIAILSTITATGSITGRPMSNNRDVDFDGDSYFFAAEGTDVVTQIAANPQVGLGYQGHHNLYVSVSGKAALVRERAAFEAHWTSDLDKWFDGGIDSPELVMIHVKATKLEYWDHRDQGEVAL